MKKLPFINNLGLKILALALAVVIYYAMKGEMPRFGKAHEGQYRQQ